MTARIPLLKIVVAGDGNVGKTSLIRQYCEGRFEQSRVATIGVDFQTKMVQIKGHSINCLFGIWRGRFIFSRYALGFIVAAERPLWCMM
ncbi:hypothetical protein MNBD_CHLOROFLEXI01-4800 [hydrothermal vent metagenome]|uniref:Uncharacterized protein n=1 Tax=hydrothermal vent metagenome TaxID=652676 RepID=A0A3B0UPX4_9ZZZZ